MDGLELRAMEYAKKLWKIYLTDRDWDRLGELIRFDPNAMWMGGMHSDCYFGSDRILCELSNRLSAPPPTYQIERDWARTIPVGEESCVVSGELYARREISGEEQLSDGLLHLHYTLLMREDKECFVLQHLHVAREPVSTCTSDLLPRSVLERAANILRETMGRKLDELERAEDQFRRNELRYRQALEAANDFVFEIDFESRSVEIVKAKMAGAPERLYYPMDAQSELFFPEDRRRAGQIFTVGYVNEMVSKGELYHAEEFRMVNTVSGESFWVASAVVPIVGQEGNVTRAVCTIKNIDEQKRAELEIQKQSQTDLLTGLYNKHYTETLIAQRLEACSPEDFAALFIVDIDSFKAINDQLGHMLGDAVLSDIAAKLLRLFRKSDLVGRIGGDEFMIYMHGLRDVVPVLEKAEALIEMFRHTYVGRNRDHRVSASVGIALYPRDGIGFTTLYERADMALYSAKLLGKNQYRLYEETMSEEHWLPVKTLVESRVFRAVPTNRHFGEYVFRILYDAADLEYALTLTLEIVGRYFEVSRVFMIQVDPIGKKVRYTNEWCNEGILPLPYELAVLTDVEKAAYVRHFDDDGVFFCPDVGALEPELRTRLQAWGVSALLQCALRDEGTFVGTIGFQEEEGFHPRTQSELDTMAQVARILGIFLLKLHGSSHKTRRSMPPLPASPTDSPPVRSNPKIKV